MEDNQARVNITIAGLNGDLPDSVNFDASDADIKAWLVEALRTGSIPGIPVQAAPDLDDYVIDRFAANEVRPYALIQSRPKTPFGR